MFSLAARLLLAVVGAFWIATNAPTLLVPNIWSSNDPNEPVYTYPDVLFDAPPGIMFGLLMLAPVPRVARVPRKQVLLLAGGILGWYWAAWGSRAWGLPTFVTASMLVYLALVESERRGWYPLGRRIDEALSK